MSKRPPSQKPERASSGDPRQIALDILCRVESGAYADRLLQSHRDDPNLVPADLGLLQELVRGALTWQGTIDHLLTPYLKAPLSRLSPGLRNLLRLGVYQLRYLDRIPAYAVVSEAVTLARRRDGAGAAGMVNALLRGISENRRPVQNPDPQTDPEGHLCVSASHPRWMVRRWVRRFGLEETRKLCEANNRRARLTLRPNPLRTTPEALGAALAAGGVRTQPAPLLPAHLDVLDVGPLFQTEAYRNGLFSVQSPGAGLVVPLLDPQPEERILDLCSAPGGKATAAAERMEDRGHVLALDLRPERLRTLRSTLCRLGLHSVQTAAADGCRAPIRATFHRVLVDAPCSALGILARRPEIRWRRREADIRKLSRLQQKLLGAVADRVGPNGILVYSTCTIEPEENERIVEAFLNRRPDFRLEPASDLLGPSLAGPYLQILPHRHGGDGAFAARLRRAGFLGVESSQPADNS